jgi:hypothetical protein
MPIAGFPSEIGQRILSLLETEPAKTTLFGSGAMVFYGDQDKLPVTPTVCVETGTTSRPLAGVPAQVEANHTCYILIYYGKVQSTEVNKREGEVMAEAVVRFLDDNLQLRDSAGNDPMVIHGWCTEIDPGYAIKDGTLWHAVRITWQGKSKYRLGAL